MSPRVPPHRGGCVMTRLGCREGRTASPSASLPRKRRRRGGSTTHESSRAEGGHVAEGGAPRTGDDQLLAAIVESSDDAIVSKTLDGVVTSWNRGAERLFGYAASEMIGRPIGVLAAPGREPDFADILARVRHGERVEHFETTRRTKDGRIIDVSVTVSPIRDDRGAIVGASKIAR